MARTTYAASGTTGARRWPVLALMAVFLASMPAVTPRIYASDEIQYFAYLRSLWFDGDVAFENEYQHFYDAGIARTAGFHETFLERTTEAGRRINFATIGCAILWTPFYLAGDVTARALHARGAPVAVDGYSWPYVAAVAYASATYGFLALLTAIAAIRRIAGTNSAMSRASVPAACAIWFGTPLVFYMYVAPPMSHATSAFAVAAFVLAWIVVRERWSAGGLALLGALAALMAMVREQDAFFVAGPALDLALFAARLPDWRERGRLAVRTLMGAGACALAYAPQAIAYMALNGHLGPTRLVARKMTWTAPHALEVLGSPAHGFFVWTPLAVLAIVSLALVPRAASARPRAAVLAVCMECMVLMQVYVAGSVESWTVAGAFGQRRFVGLTALLVIGLAALLASSSLRLRTAWALAIVAGVWWNLGLMAQFGAGLMDRQRLEPAENAYNSFVVLPGRLPDLAWRYLFDRASFYQQSRQRRDDRP